MLITLSDLRSSIRFKLFWRVANVIVYCVFLFLCINAWPFHITMTRLSAANSRFRSKFPIFLPLPIQLPIHNIFNFGYQKPFDFRIIKLYDYYVFYTCPHFKSSG